jgi:hypothetical protein
MDVKERLKAMLQEAEIYRSQGLINEASEKYQKAIRFIKDIKNLKNKESLLKLIGNKLNALGQAQEKVEQVSSTPELSKKAQDLIKNLFAFSENKDEDAAALEGAVALAKFGQFDRALDELNALLGKENVRVEAAKNILRCHLAVAPVDEAIDQYQKWFSDDIFLPSQLESVRSYLEDILRKRGMEVALPSALDTIEMPENEAETLQNLDGDTEEEFLDITSIGITFENGPSKGKMVEFDVNFQSGNMLSLIISKKDQDLISEIKTGSKLKDIQFYSPIAIFNGSGMVSSKTQIKSGPKLGDFCLDIKIVST